MGTRNPTAGGGTWLGRPKGISDPQPRHLDGGRCCRPTHHPAPPQWIEGRTKGYLDVRRLRRLRRLHASQCRGTCPASVGHPPGHGRCPLTLSTPPSTPAVGRDAKTVLDPISVGAAATFCRCASRPHPPYTLPYTLPCRTVTSWGRGEGYVSQHHTVGGGPFEWLRGGQSVQQEPVGTPPHTARCTAPDAPPDHTHGYPPL